MVSTMASAYNGLSEGERSRVFLQAVGLYRFRQKDQNFCQGFAACADNSDSSWWKDWNANQRDIFFYTKQANGSWEFYCRYSMNTNRNEFDATIREMLDVVDMLDDDLVGNETQIQVGEESSTASYGATSSSSSKTTTCAIGGASTIMLATVLGWFI